MDGKPVIVIVADSVRFCDPLWSYLEGIGYSPCVAIELKAAQLMCERALRPYAVIVSVPLRIRNGCDIDSVIRFMADLRNKSSSLPMVCLTEGQRLKAEDLERLSDLCVKSVVVGGD